MNYVRYRIYRIKYVLYMYNLGTAPNVQNLPEIAVCTPEAIAIDHCICYIDYNSTHRTQPGHWPRILRYNLKGRSRMVSRLVIVVHVLKIQDASRPVRFGRVNTHLGASSCHQHGESVPPRRLELRRRPVI